MLYIVPTPIGNLKDITLRTLNVLKEVDGIICEDTRRTSLLLNHYEIKKPLSVLNDYNEARTVPQLLAKLQSGQNLALVSDAGTPLISDPGYKLVRECLAQDIPVDSLPGPSAVITALTLSSLPPQPFTFMGYPPEKPKARLDLLQNIQSTRQHLGSTYVFFTSPYKLVSLLKDIDQVLGNIEVVIAKELTKIHQSVKRRFVNSWLEQFTKQKPKGEYVLMFRLLPPEK